MYDFIVAEFNTSFSIALALVVGLTLFELLGVLVGLSLLNVLDDLVPVDLGVDADADLDAGPLSGLLGWLCLDQLPLLIWLLLLLSSFGLLGISLNYLSLTQLNWLPPVAIVNIAALLGGLYCTRLFGGAIAKVVPKSESSAVSKETFHGLKARITVGTARLGNPAEAVCIDDYGQKHYLMVQPTKEGEEFPAGTEVVLLERVAQHWSAAALKELLND